jgi:hypothetical protein
MLSMGLPLLIKNERVYTSVFIVPSKGREYWVYDILAVLDH